MKRLIIIVMLYICFGSLFCLPSFADDSLGDIVFYENFETLTSPQNGGKLTAKLSADFGGGDITLYDGATGTSFTVDSPITGGTKMLGIGGTAQYPQLFLPNLNFTKEGKYTLVYDYYVPTDLTLWFLQTGLSTTRRFAYGSGSLQTVTESFEIAKGSGSTIPNIFIQAGKDVSVNKYYYVDNLRLYYLAEKAPDTEYGILIDKNDFESANSLDASLGTTGSGMYHFGTGASFSVGIPAEVTGADNMLKVTTTTQTAASAGYANMEITRAGTYTFVFDCFVSNDYPLGWFKVKNNIEDVTIALQEGVKATYTAQIKLEEGQTLTQIFFQSYNYGSAINGSFYIDNIKLYLEPESYHFSDYATNLVTTFTGDAKTQRGFAWTADITCDEMVIRYSEKGENLAENYTEVAGKYEAYEGKFYYKAELTGLKPGTEYVYTIGSVQKNAWSDELVFETEPEEISSYKVLAFADPQVDNTNVAAVWTSNAEKAFSDVPDAKFSLGLGDLVNLGTDEKQWQMYFDGFGGACETIPNMCILGNHEARAGIAGKNFRLHFNNPDNGHSALGGLTKNDFAETYTKELVDNFAESVYSFDYGNAHFVALNTGSDWAASTDGIKLVKAQLAWLENDLYNSNAKWNIVMVHRPVYDCFDPESEGSLATVLDSVLSEYGVDLVLQGHEHYIARTYPIKNKEAVITEDANAVEKGTGVVYFTAGRASNLSVSSPKNIPDYIANFANTAGGNPTYTVLEVGEDKLSVVTKTLNGEIADSFEIISHGESDTPVKPVREILVYEDFEDVADGTVIFNSTDCGTLTAYKNSYVNATNPGTASIYKDKLFCITRGGELNTSYVTPLNGNRLVRVDQRTDGVSAYPQIGLYGGNTNANSPFGITAGGVYTLKVDFYLPAEYASKIKSFSVQTNVSEQYTNTFIAVDNSATVGKWYTLSTDVVLDGTKELKYFRIIGNTSSAKDGVTFYVDNIKLYCRPDKPFLKLSADSITSDGQSITITPYASETNLTVLGDTHYTTDSICALLERNEDGTATLTGKLNGKITVTAHFENENIPDASVTVDVSGQSERAAATSLKVLMFGNSILNHPPAPDIGWTGNWGMAASSEDKDYAHRLMYYIDQKFGSGTAEYIRGYWMAGLEGIWREHQNDPDYDFTADMAGHIKSVTDTNPDIITIQCGENARVTNKDSYINSLGQLVAAFKKAAPDAHIVICTPFWGGDAMVEGVKAVASEYGLQHATLHVLNTPENKAPQFSHGGVANHPGDTGMDNIAKLIYAEVNAILSESSPVKYSAKPEAVEISGESTITEDAGSITLTANVLPEDASDDVLWFVNDGNIAQIDDNGVLTAISNGSVIVRAVSKYDENAFGEYTVTISGQSEPFTVTFLKNADEAVEGIPEPLKRKGKTEISGYYPTRTGYRFMGWSTEPLGEAVETIDVKSDINLYAKWSVADFFDFERDGFGEGFVIENGFNKYILGGVYHAIATDTDFASGNVLTVVSPDLALDTNDYDGLVINMQVTDFNEGTMLDLKVSTTTGDYYYRYPVTSSEFASYTFDLSDAEGVITGFILVPVNMDCTIRIDEICFTKSQSTNKNVLRCNNGYASLVCEIENDTSEGKIAIIAYYENGRIVKTEIELLEAKSVNTVSSYFATNKDIDTAKVFVLNGFVPIKAPVVITK